MPKSTCLPDIWGTGIFYDGVPVGNQQHVHVLLPYEPLLVSVRLTLNAWQYTVRRAEGVVGLQFPGMCWRSR